MNSSMSECEIAEELLAAAGIEFAVVDHCPDAACELCGLKGLSAAA